MSSSTRAHDLFFQPSPLAGSHLRQAITAAGRLPEPEIVPHLLEGARLSPDQAAKVQALARRIAGTLREREADGGRAGLVRNLLQEYALSSKEGIALMCLAEALLRIPDAATRDALIRDKLTQGEWRTHLGKSPSLFVNAATWGLLITGTLVSTHSESGLGAALARLVAVGGEPLIRKGVDMAMRMMGEQFVTGETIAQALRNARSREQEGFRYSFDMLGEAALTAEDARRYLRAYEEAIHAIGQASAGRGIHEGPGISIKLSALHPRYSRAQYDRVMGELYPVLLQLCALAKRYDIGLNIDAEEADRLELSLDLLDKLSFEPQLQGWNGLGFVVQAYQKRCLFVIDHLIDLARRSQRRLMIRLVKGAYWDSEIKRAQVDGHDGYPVYTRKPYTDAAYIACARKLLGAPEAVYPQFATHNAHTLAAVHEIAQPHTYTRHQYEFQCLHGMGEPLYEQVVGDPAQGKLGRPCRVYAPVGTHETLLAYLVRRLLENGANTSFVHQVADRTITVDTLVRDPVDAIETYARTEGALGLPHPAIALPRDLYGPTRRNSRGIDLNNEAQLRALADAFAAAAQEQRTARPMLAADTPELEMTPVLNPADPLDAVGWARAATADEIDLALRWAVEGAPAWSATPPAQRARLLDDAADRLESGMPRLMSVLIREAGKTASNAVAEVREAVDFLRYYAREVREQFDNATHRPLGPVVCISPWNFPLAIFVGQIAAALAAGNTVLAKPAEQTPLIAAEAVRALWDAGIPRAALQLLPGPGAVVGARLVGDARTQGVVFTGSTEVARLLQASVAGRVTASGRAIPLIAETGGQNAMIVDSSALAQQVVGDVLVSAFDSAGQRCSALRVLCVQEEAADTLLEMLLGAMAELHMGDPGRLATDVGPVIDEEARASIERHVQAMRARGHTVHRAAGHHSQAPLPMGAFVPPTLIEIDSISELTREVFGPVLHFVRYQREQLDGLLRQINATGYGLTLGLHTRIDETIHHVVQHAHAGNIYVNRNMVGAVVGVQPFGGEGLSGTGPKAGGPLYLYRLLATRPQDVLERARGARVLPGPTGEQNTYSIAPRSSVLCLADTDADRLVQLRAVLAVGSRAIWPADAQDLLRRLPAEVQAHVALARDWRAADVAYEAVLLHGSTRQLAQVQQHLARREGPIVSVERMDCGQTSVPLERLVVERAVSINTAAAGGNASLMAL
ncbi:MAG: trifunctional transcriptional regulator/proline dehydrogenase/L-glutamate gamma-semialdehyde dehydrogenase [Pseudomonadota bacterium]